MATSPGVSRSERCSKDAYDRLCALAATMYRLPVLEINNGVWRWVQMGYSEDAIAGLIRRLVEFPK